MKSKTYARMILMCVLAALALAVAGCGDGGQTVAGGGNQPKTEDNPPLVEEPNSLSGTSWKLVAIVDAETGEITLLEPKDCENCYTLVFDPESMVVDDGFYVSAYSTGNTGWGAYDADYKTGRIRIEMERTLLPEPGEGEKLWWEIFPSIELFALQKNELKLYYNNNKKYFKFDKIEEINNDVITQNFYVFYLNKDEQCGYLLFEDRGSVGHYHDSFVWAENLPEEYREHLLPVTVMFHNTGEKCGDYPKINIIKIQKQ